MLNVALSFTVWEGLEAVCSVRKGWFTENVAVSFVALIPTLINRMFSHLKPMISQ